jgi:hypothetical protein
VQFVLISKFPVLYGSKDFLLTIRANEDFQILNLKMEEERIIMCISECAAQSSSTTAIRVLRHCCQLASVPGLLCDPLL